MSNAIELYSFLDSRGKVRESSCTSLLSSSYMCFFPIGGENNATIGEAGEPASPPGVDEHPATSHRDRPRRVITCPCAWKIRALDLVMPGTSCYNENT